MVSLLFTVLCCIGSMVLSIFHWSKVIAGFLDFSSGEARPQPDRGQGKCPQARDNAWAYLVSRESSMTGT